VHPHYSAVDIEVRVFQSKAEAINEMKLRNIIRTTCFALHSGLTWCVPQLTLLAHLPSESIQLFQFCRIFLLDQDILTWFVHWFQEKLEKAIPPLLLQFRKSTLTVTAARSKVAAKLMLLFIKF